MKDFWEQELDFYKDFKNSCEKHIERNDYYNCHHCFSNRKYNEALKEIKKRNQKPRKTPTFKCANKKCKKTKRFNHRNVACSTYCGNEYLKQKELNYTLKQCQICERWEKIKKTAEYFACVSCFKNKIKFK